MPSSLRARPEGRHTERLPAKAINASTWAMISTSWKCADSSVPITQIAVITMINATVSPLTTQPFSTRSSAPNASSA